MVVDRRPTDTWTVARALAELPPDDRWEIDAGRLEMHEPRGPYHGDATFFVTACLGAFVRRHRLGRVLAGDPGFHLAHDPDILRAPDVAVLSNARLAAITDPDAFSTVPLDPAIEPMAVRWHGRPVARLCRRRSVGAPQQPASR